VIVVLCGETNPALLARFKEHYGLSVISLRSMTVVVKEDAAKVAKS
jgi:hypothetical protein